MGNLMEKVCLREPDQPNYSAIKNNNAKDASPDMKNAKGKMPPQDLRYLGRILWFDDTQRKLFTPEKVIYLYPDFEAEQKYYDKSWVKIDLENLPNSDFKRKKSNDVMVPEWKIIIRRGIPLYKMRKVILHMFRKIWTDNDLDYKFAVEKQFSEDRLPNTFKNAPTFTNVDTLEELLTVHFLTEEGLYAAKKMLWVLKGTEATLQYSPMVPQIIALMLVFFSESETYVIIKMMLAESRSMLDETQQFNARQLRGLRWHLTMNQEDYEKFIKSFYDEVAKKSKSFYKLQSHFNKIEFDHLKMFQECFRHLFLGWLPVNFVIKIFNCYMNEGIKIYYRMGYAFVRILKKEILACKDPAQMKDLIKMKLNNLDKKNTKKLFKKAFELSLNKIKKGFSAIEVDISHLEKAKVHYRPNLSKPSSIVKDDAFETIWEWIPSTYKIADPERVYSSYEDGFSLSTVYTKCRSYASSGSMIILMKSDHGTVFGAFIDDVFSGDSHYVGSDQAFVFTLSPQAKCYTTKAKDSRHLFSSKDHFAIGEGGDGPAIYLDEDLLNGQSYACATYQNPQFNGKVSRFEADFKCLAMEVYVIE